jgi:TPR repeat protein
MLASDRGASSTAEGHEGKEPGQPEDPKHHLVKGMSVANIASPHAPKRTMTEPEKPKEQPPEEKKWIESTLPRTEIEKGWKEAFSHYNNLMMQGREATYRVAICYVFGMGVVKIDYKKGVELLEQALVNRIRGAASLLAQAHFGGRGVAKNMKEANRLWTLDLEDPHAQLYCAVCVCKPTDKEVPKLFSTCIPLLTKLADSGDARAQYDLGKAHFYAWGATKDATKAAQYYVKAAKQGHAGAQWALGDLYRKGEGVKKDETMANQLVKQSYDQGYEDPTK